MQQHCSEPQDFIIGKKIEEELRKQERSVKWLSQKLNCDRRNIYDIFSRFYIDTGLLWRLSMILSHDFFADYSNAFYMEKQRRNDISSSAAITEPVTGSKH